MYIERMKMKHSNGFVICQKAAMWYSLLLPTLEYDPSFRLPRHDPSITSVAKQVISGHMTWSYDKRAAGESLSLWALEPCTPYMWAKSRVETLFHNLSRCRVHKAQTPTCQSPNADYGPEGYISALCSTHGFDVFKISMMLMYDNTTEPRRAPRRQL